MLYDLPFCLTVRIYPPKQFQVCIKFSQIPGPHPHCRVFPHNLELLIFIFQDTSLHLIIHGQLVPHHRPIRYGPSVPLLVQLAHPQVQGFPYRLFPGERAFFRHLAEAIQRLDIDILKRLCYVLECNLTDLIEYIPPEETQTLQ